MDNIIRKRLQGKQKRQYFTKETENAIIRYNNSTDSEERSLIYQEYIHFPFFKLTQNIIHTFKFYNTDVENLEDIQHEIMVFLLSKIHLFDPSKGAKAYSYFGTIVKRWLILYNNNNYKKKINNISIEDLNSYSNLDTSNPNFIFSNKRESDIETIKEDDSLDMGELSFAGFKHNDKLSHFVDLYIQYCTDNIYKLFPKEKDAKTADAILEIFRKRDNIDIFNKKALYIYIREQVDVKTPKITTVAKKLGNIFKEKYLVYLETDEFKF